MKISPSHRTFLLLFLLAAVPGVAFVVVLTLVVPGGPPSPYTGSLACRACHERFYALWSTSHHGLAMQAFTPALAAKAFRDPAEPIAVRG